MQSLTLQLPVSRACLCDITTSQQTPYLVSTRAVRRAACIPRPARRLRFTEKWKKHGKSPTLAVNSLDQTDTASWREKDDTACIAQQQAVTHTRLQQLFTTQYDREIMAVLFPALLAILLDPVMILVDTGVRSLLPFPSYSYAACLPGVPIAAWLCVVVYNSSGTNTYLVCGCSYCWATGNSAPGSCRTQQPSFLLLHSLLQLPSGSHHPQSSQCSCKQQSTRGDFLTVPAAYSSK